MRHKKKGRKFGRETKERKALMRSLARSLVIKEKIETTEAKAKELRSKVEKMVSKARIGSLSARRAMVSNIGERGGKKLVDVIAPRYIERKGGYTRVVKLPRRQGDAARMAIIEFV